MLNKVVAFFIVFFVYFGLALDVRSQSSQNPLDLDNVLQGLVETKRVLQDDFVEFSCKCRTEKIEILIDSNEGQKSRAEWMLFRKGNMWKTTSRKIEAAVKQNAWSTLFILKNGLALEYYPNGLCAISSPDVGFEFWGHWRFFVRTGIDILGVITSTNKMDIVKLREKGTVDSTFRFFATPLFPACLESNKSNYRLYDEMEEVDGNLCFVLEWNKHDKVWIDPKCGYAIRKRTQWFVREGVKEYEIINHDFDEVRPGLWLPKKQVVVFYADPSYQPKSLWDRAMQKVTYLAEYQLTVDDAEFNFRPPIGTRVVDTVRGTQYTIHEEDTDPFAGPIELARGANRYVVIRALFIIVGSLMILFAVWRMLRDKESK